MSVKAGVCVSDTVTVRDKLFGGKIVQTKVKRYWPGKIPEWADENNEDAAAADIISTWDTAIVRKNDRRLRRLAEEVRVDDCSIPHAETFSTIEIDEDAMAERRRQLKEKLLQRELEEEALPREDEDEEESEYETCFDDDDDDEYTRIATMPVITKAVFVSKFERHTLAERDRLVADEEALEEERIRRLEERRIETKQIVAREVLKNEYVQKNIEDSMDDVDTDNEINEAEEYEAWKVREICRIKRNREDGEALLKKKEEVRKRARNTTEEERREWERENPKSKPSQSSKQKFKFMQKYYHKGAFFQSNPDDRAATVGTDIIFALDFSVPTGEDRMDKTMLPKIMQVKNFGRRGRTNGPIWSTRTLL